MVVAKTVLLLTQQVVFGKIIVKSSVQYLFKYFWKVCQNWYRSVISTNFAISRLEGISLSPDLIANRFHIKLHILSPHSIRTKKMHYVTKSPFCEGNPKHTFLHQKHQFLCWKFFHLQWVYSKVYITTEDLAHKLIHLMLLNAHADFI